MSDLETLLVVDLMRLIIDDMNKYISEKGLPRTFLGMITDPEYAALEEAFWSLADGANLTISEGK